MRRRYLYGMKMKQGVTKKHKIFGRLKINMMQINAYVKMVEHAYLPFRLFIVTE